MAWARHANSLASLDMNRDGPIRTNVPWSRLAFDRQDL